MFVHQLREVLVTGRDQGIRLLLGRLFRIGADDIVSLDTRHDDHRITQCLDQFIQRLDLVAKIIRHRRAVRLVLFIEIIAESLALGIEHHSDMFRLIFFDQFIQHIDDAVDRPGWLTLAVGQRRQRMESTEQVG